MKVCILGDVHIGARNDSQIFAEYHISFFENQLFPYMEKNGISHIIQLGDIFDRRKFVNFNLLSQWKDRVFDVMSTKSISLDIILGNHDCYYRNTNDVNSPSLLLSEYDNIRIFEAITNATVGEYELTYIPWINPENEKSTFEFIKKHKTAMGFAHLELSGFEMDRGHVMDHGMSKDLFDGFEFVLTGHYHHKSSSGNIQYTGIPYQITWSDYGSEKGFYVLDLSTRTYDFVKNPNEMFVKITYNDTFDPDNHYKGFDVSNLTGKYIKILVVNKKNIFGFDSLMSKIFNQNPADVKIVENMIIEDGDEDEEDLQLETTDVILKKYVQSADTSLDKAKLNSYIHELYVTAVNMENA
jgi:DNA repair exonuclease SbcCD nuclease subunit